ncbi:MAG TPA: DinB family protein [Gemmatimonadales bacterium]|nr:DinB family protein [Gemmatimonadales bacterium]
MAIRESILPEFDHEMATTRLLLERVPGDKAGWKPHPKSMSLGELSSHLADIPHWVPWTLEADSFDIAPPGAEPYRTPPFASRDEVLRRFDANVGKARASLSGTDDASFMVPWSLKHGGNVAFTLPRVAVVRTFLLNHMIHHRGQLTVYLRLQGVPLPSIYGPTADQAG